MGGNKIPSFYLPHMLMVGAADCPQSVGRTRLLRTFVMIRSNLDRRSSLPDLLAHCWEQTNYPEDQR